MSHEHRPTSLTAEEATLPRSNGLYKLPIYALIVGVLGLGASFALMPRADASGLQRFYLSYLTNFMFWLALALGGLWFTLVQHASRAGWSVVVRRFSENLMITLPIFIVLFIPIAVGMKSLYPWVGMDWHEAVGAAAKVHGFTPDLRPHWLTPGFWLIRAAIYFAIWSGLAIFFYRLSTKQDEASDDGPTKLQMWMAPIGIILFALTATFASFDWMMSLDPHWFSTMFGVIFFAGCTISVFAALPIITLMLQRAGLLRDAITVEHYQDMGKLLFGFMIFWTYVAFSQYMLIWYANMPEETHWFLWRQVGSWQAIGWVLIIGHFFLPFFFLLSRHMKRNAKTLLIGAIWMLAMEWVDLYWQIQPSWNMNHHNTVLGAHFGVVDVTTFLGIGGLVVAVFAWRMRAKPLIPIRDPRLAESLAFENS